MNGNYVPIIKKGEVCKIFLKNIILIEHDRRKSTIYTDEEKYSLYSKAEELIQFLDNRFLKCHKSYIINLDRVIRMKAQTIFFENGQKIYIGRETFHCASQCFAMYITKGAKKNLAESFDM